MVKDSFFFFFFFIHTEDLDVSFFGILEMSWYIRQIWRAKGKPYTWKNKNKNKKKGKTRISRIYRNRWCIHSRGRKKYNSAAWNGILRTSFFFGHFVCDTHTYEQAIGTEKRTKKMSERWHRQRSRAIATDGLVRVRGTQGQVAERWWIVRTQTLHVRNYTEATIFRVYAPGH